MNKQLLVALISLCIFGSGCRKGGRCETPLNVNQSEVVVTFKDTTEAELLPWFENNDYLENLLSIIGQCKIFLLNNNLIFANVDTTYS